MESRSSESRGFEDSNTGCYCSSESRSGESRDFGESQTSSYTEIKRSLKDTKCVLEEYDALKKEEADLQRELEERNRQQREKIKELKRRLGK